ncbi:putative uncharacterized protein DDB_G0286901 [Papaver somniferum]|uniref:putative uncharacterized protein DDB_G0286901 n=1 Tax=Papaver somniferum TaxID=3469 RepID=UPI000E6F59DE|nr:putative uncharacterized protein DDB_G0286901 [Papaver somniferum]
MVLKRKQSSGCQNRKKKKKRLESTKSLVVSFDKFLIRNQPAIENKGDEDNATDDNGKNEGNGDDGAADNGLNEGNGDDGAADNSMNEGNGDDGVADNGMNEGNENEGDADNSVNEGNVNDGGVENGMNDINENDRREDNVNKTVGTNEVGNYCEELSHIDMFDPANWNTIDKKLVDFLVEKGPVRIDNIKFPRDSKGDHFSSTYYFRRMRNFEKQERRWLVYSTSLDKVFCFCCKLFKKRETNYQLCESGFNDWNNLSGRLSTHENSGEHAKRKNH